MGKLKGLFIGLIILGLVIGLNRSIRAESEETRKSDEAKQVMQELTSGLGLSQEATDSLVNGPSNTLGQRLDAALKNGAITKDQYNSIVNRFSALPEAKRQVLKGAYDHGKPPSSVLHGAAQIPNGDDASLRDHIKDLKQQGLTREQIIERLRNEGVSADHLKDLGLGNILGPTPDELSRLREQDPEKFRAVMKERLAKLREEDPEAFKNIVEKLNGLRMSQREFLLKYGDTNGDGEIDESEKKALIERREELGTLWKKEKEKNNEWADISNAADEISRKQQETETEEQAIQDLKKEYPDGKFHDPEWLKEHPKALSVLSRHRPWIHDNKEALKNIRQDKKWVQNNPEVAKEMEPRWRDVDRLENVRDHKEDIKDRRENVPDRRENIRDRKEDKLDKREDIWDRKNNWNDDFFQRKKVDSNKPPQTPRRGK